MPYTTIPSLSDGQVLSASFLNQLSANQAFLYGVANNANAPFNSYRATTFSLGSGEMIWYIRHRCPWLHWRLNADANWTYARMYYGGVKVGQALAAATWTGTANLTSWSGVPNFVGPWASGVAYDDDVNGSNDDGAVVSQGGQYYRCKLSHTSAAGNQPGVGASWATYWDLLTLPGIGTMCQIWVEVFFSGTHEIGVEYIVETDNVSF